MKHRALLFSFLIWTSTCFAQEIAQELDSEFQHQARANTTEVSPWIDFSTTRTAFPATDTADENVRNSFSYGAAVERGLNKQIAVGTFASYGWNWNDYSPADMTQDTHRVGVFDPGIYIEGKFKRSIPGALHTRLSYSRSLKDKTNANNSSGGSTVSLSIGYELNFESHIGGIRMKYDWKATGSKYVPEEDFEFEIRGGDIFSTSLFYEYVTSPSTFGLALEVVSVKSSTITAESTAARDFFIAAGVDRTVPYSSSFTAVGVNAYMPYDCSRFFRLIPTLTYAFASVFDATAFSSYRGWEINLAGRYVF